MVRREGSGLHMLKVRKLVVDHGGQTVNEEKPEGRPAELCSNLSSQTWLCGLDYRLHLSLPSFSHLYSWDDVGRLHSCEGVVGSLQGHP